MYVSYWKKTDKGNLQQHSPSIYVQYWSAVFRDFFSQRKQMSVFLRHNGETTLVFIDFFLSFK